MSTFGRANRFTAVDDVPLEEQDQSPPTTAAASSTGSTAKPKKYRMRDAAGIVSRVAAVRRLPHLRANQRAGNGGSPTSRSALLARQARTSTSSVGSLRRSNSRDIKLKASRRSDVVSDRPQSPFQATPGIESILKRIVALERRRQELLVELDMHTRQQQVLEKQRSEFQSAIAATRQEIEEREGVVEANVSAVEAAGRRVKELTSAQEACEAEIQKLRAQVGTLADLVRDLTGQVDSRKQELEGRRAAINALMDQQKDVETQRQAEKAAIAEFKRETAMLEEEASHLNHTLEEEELALRQARRENAELERAVSQFRDGMAAGDGPSLWSPPAGAATAAAAASPEGKFNDAMSPVAVVRRSLDDADGGRKLDDDDDDDEYGEVGEEDAEHDRGAPRDHVSGPDAAAGQLANDRPTPGGPTPAAAAAAGPGSGSSATTATPSPATPDPLAPTPGGPLSAFRRPSPIVQPRVVAAASHARRRRDRSLDSRPSVDAWRLGDQIGEGAFSRVFLGLNEATGEFIAVKELKEKIFESGAENLDSSRARRMKRLEDEIKLMERLHHPNIVSYLGTSQKEMVDGSTRFYILLEYVPGGSISGVLKRFGSLAERTIRGYTRQTLSGLAYLHRHGAVHRDVKGANLLVATDGTIRVADFGCSTVFRSETLSTDIPQSPGGASSARSSRGARDRLLGSVPWMSPEALRQERSGRKSDIWSLGCSVVEMATGKRPWHHIDHVLTLLFHVATTCASPQIPDGLSDECLDFLSHCFEKDPEARWSAEELLGHPFVQDVDRSVVSSPEPVVSPPG